MLELINVKKVYKTKVGDTNALNGLSLTLPDSGLVFITGKSGCGKTTLLNCVGGLDSINDGDIIIDGKKFSEFTDKDYDSYRNTFMGFIFQEYNLLPDYTVEKNIQIATELQGIQADPQAINDILKLVDLEGLNLRKPSQLSGGQKQRVAIARALVKNPKIIMADEPTGALDSATGIQVMETLKKLSKDKLVIIVSHDLELAEKFADRIVRLVDGRLVEDITLTDTEIKSNVYNDENGLVVKNGSELTSNETATLVKAIRDRKNIKFTDKIDIKIRTKKPTENIVAVHPETPVDFVNSKMKYKSAAGMGVRSLKVKPIRLAMTILLSVIAFALFGVFDTIGAYSDTRSIANLLRSDDYTTVALNSSYASNSNATNIRVTQQTIDDLNKQTGYDFRGLYEINDKSQNGIQIAASILELASTQQTGSKYYYNYLDDFMEFAPNEIDGKTIDPDGFNFKIIHGEFPTLPLDENNELIEPVTTESFTNIAISKYMAESILYWLGTNAGEDIEGNKRPMYLTDETGNAKEVKEIQDLVGCKITLENGYFDAADEEKLKYVIKGIVDCGDVPAKYDSLKTAFPNASTQALADDLATFINTGAHLKAFVPKGYVRRWRDFNDRENTSFAGGYVTQLVYNSKQLLPLSFTTTAETRTAYYNYTKDYAFSDKIYLFEGVETLQDNQVIISGDMLLNLYAQEFNSITQISGEILYQMVNALKSENIDLNTKLTNISIIEKALGAMAFKKITIQQKNVVTNDITLNQFTIAGIYVNINMDIPDYAGLYKNNPLMLTSGGLEKLGVNTNQGEYARMISPINTSYFNANKLASRIANNDDIRLRWYRNSVLTNINANKQQLQQFANLFLYVAILLAAFSIFMLFNYISTSIVSKRQSIGVLRALGSNGRDVFRMFITESMIISIINGILACGVAALGCIFVNNYIRNVMNLTINFAIFGFRQIIIIILSSIITGILSSLFPIIKICKEKPVELIRKS